MKKFEDMIRKEYYKLRSIWYKKDSKNVCNIEREGIIFVTHRLDKGGAETLLLYMLKNYRAKGIPVVVISRKFGPLVKKFQEYAYTVALENKSEIISFANKLRQEYGYNRVLLNTAVNGDLAEDLKKMDYCIISAVHELDNTIKHLNIQESAVAMAKFSDVIIFPSDFVRKRFEDNWEVHCKYASRHQGLFLTEGKQCDVVASRKRIMELHPNIQENDLIVLNVATGNLRKGIDFFIELAILAYKDKRNIKFIWIGDNTRKYIKRVKKKYQLKDVPNLICPGYISEVDLIQNYYCAADVFCLTSREEPFGSVVLEALNAYTPVVAFEDCGGYLDVVKPGITGALAHKYDVNDMYKQILLLEDKNKRVALGESGHALVQKCNFDEYCQFYLDVFTTL